MEISRIQSNCAFTPNRNKRNNDKKIMFQGNPLTNIDFNFLGEEASGLKTFLPNVFDKLKESLNNLMRNFIGTSEDDDMRY